eukprot:476573-Amphidinium_carterae.1
MTSRGSIWLLGAAAIVSFRVMVRPLSAGGSGGYVGELVGIWESSPSCCPRLRERGTRGWCCRYLA